MNPNNPRIIVALDFPTVELAYQLVRQLNPTLCRLKVANTLFTQAGPQFVEDLMAQGFEVFLDLKYHDIPQQVAGACRAAAELGVWMVNVHVQGGRAMLEAAVEAIHQFSHPRPLLIGVTVLTSLQDEDLIPLGVNLSIDTLVPRMALMAKQAGLDGVVCSSQEAQILREKIDHSFVLVTPGIRLPDDDVQDQKRILTPRAAIQAGATYLVVGRPITQARHPLEVLEKIQSEIIF